MFSRIFWFGLLLSLGTTDLLAQVPCNGGYVSFDAHAINIGPTGLDDTQNLQCALDYAVANNFPSIKLGRAEYYISSVIAEDFIGTLSGVSKATTTINIINNSINCQLMLDQDRAPAAIKFSGGEPRIRNMTIATDTPCIDNNIGFYALHFTGVADQVSGCQNDLIFGSVDRLVIQGTDVYAPTSTAVAALGEGSYFGGCQTTLLGTFKLNRSEVMGYTNGVTTILHASAQVDINFNQFEHNRFDVVIPNANQSTTITRNDFVGVATNNSGYMGVQVLTNAADAPVANRVVIHKNTFDIEASGSYTGSAIVFDQTAKIANLSTIASGNTFGLNGNAAYGIIGGGVSGAIINGNKFDGSAAAGILANPANSAKSSDWAILANTGFNNLLSQGPDIILGPDLSNSIVGALQTSKVQDTGSGNSVLPIVADKALQGRVSALEALVATLTAQLNTHTASATVHHQRYADSEAVATVGPHFSGSHADLTSVTTGQHHAKYTTADAIAAVGSHSPDYSTLLAGVTRGTDPGTGYDTLRFTGMNLQLVNGTGTTGGAPNGKGNLIIGYNELRDETNATVVCPSVVGTEIYCNRRTGSHMSVVGAFNNYSSFGGAVTGRYNETSGQYTSVSGGQWNIAKGLYASVSGGSRNSANGPGASVSGGNNNEAGGQDASVSGGQGNEATGAISSIAGGTSNETIGNFASISGGFGNTAKVRTSSILGGLGNETNAIYGVIIGGSANILSAAYGVVVGGLNNTASGEFDVILGGDNIDCNLVNDGVCGEGSISATD